jgi:hypothetical protein
MNEETEDSVVSLRDELEIALDEQEEETGGPEQDPEESLGAEASLKAERDEHGRFKAKGPGDEPAEPVDNPDQPVDNLQAGVRDDSPLARPPASWKPVAQQAWGSLPENVREEVMRREYDVQRFMQESAPVRKMGEQLIQAAEPYRALIAAEGVDPVTAAANMFQTAAVLKTGSPIQKATMLAQIVSTYSVPLDVLDTVLSEHMRTGGAVVPSAQQMPQPPQPQVDPREIAQQVRYEIEQEQAYNGALSEVEAFIQQQPAAGYLRNEMADLIDAYPGMTLQEAFDNAILNHPQLQSLAQQTQHEAPQESQQSRSKRARRAASSIKSSPATSQKAQPDDLRGALLDAFENVG